MKKVFAFMAVAALALALGGCGGSGGGQSSSAALDFDGSGATDAGQGVMYIATAGGTSEGGNVPQITGGTLVQIGLDIEGMDGSVCTVYVDGMENDKLNAGERTQNSISLTGDALKKGVHTVELVKLDDSGNPVIYKVAQYEVVE